MLLCRGAPCSASSWSAAACRLPTRRRATAAAACCRCPLQAFCRLGPAQIADARSQRPHEARQRRAALETKGDVRWRAAWGYLGLDRMRRGSAMLERREAIATVVACRALPKHDSSDEMRAPLDPHSVSIMNAAPLPPRAVLRKAPAAYAPAQGSGAAGGGSQTGPRNEDGPSAAADIGQVPQKGERGRAGRCSVQQGGFGSRPGGGRWCRV